jgi:hypothetical protein
MKGWTLRERTLALTGHLAARAKEGSGTQACTIYLENQRSRARQAIGPTQRLAWGGC